MSHAAKIHAALELLREARNNMERAAYMEAVTLSCADGNLRYPLIDAGTAAVATHHQALLNPKPIEDDSEPAIK
jgi:hypothetical protein